MPTLTSKIDKCGRVSNPGHRIVDQLRKEALQLGFDALRITSARGDSVWSENLAQALKLQHHASMDWLKTTYERRSDPQSLWPQAKSIILLGLNYGPDENPLAVLSQVEKANISVYARNKDYHDLIKGRLKTLAQKMLSFAKKDPQLPQNIDVKVFVDTAPVLEKPIAARAGLGWQGKHSNLVSRELGSWFFIGSIFTTLELPFDAPELDHCGSCRSCLDICPTNAFPRPYQLDARRCISYLTIEHHGPIDRQLRPLMGNRIYGCDDCLAVCPWNKFAKVTNEIKLAARDDLKAPDLAWLSKLNDKDFRSLFSGSPIKRIGRNRFIRNVLIAIGNSKSPALADCAKPHLNDDDPQIRGAAVWALSRLLTPDSFKYMASTALPCEKNSDVRQEWLLGGVTMSIDTMPKQKNKTQ